MSARLGIGGKLLLAFGGISMLTVASALVAWFAFERAANVQEKVVHQTVPFLSDALALAETSNRIILSSPSLSGAGDLSQGKAAFERLRRQVTQMSAVLDNLETAGASVGELRGIISRVSANLDRQNTLVAARIADQTRFLRQTTDRLDAVNALVGISGALVSNAVTAVTATIVNLYELAESPVDLAKAPKILDRLIEVDVDDLERMFELRHRSAVVGLLIGQLEHTAEPGKIDELKTQYGENLKIISRRVRHVEDPYRRAEALSAVDRLGGAALGSGQPDIFALRRRVLDNQQGVVDLAAANAAQFGDLRERVDRLVSRSRAELSDVADRSAAALTTGKIVLLIIAVLSLLIAAAIAWFYVRARIAKRIVKLSEVTRQLADGNLAVEVHDRGNDELSDMADVLTVFRTNELEKRETEAELRRHKEELEQIVSERTVQLSDANARLSEEVVRHDAAREQAESASRAKSAFLAAMSHEIRTPITGILGTLQLLDERTPPDEQRDRLDVIRASGETLLSIISDILDYSKIESGHLKVVPSNFSLTPLVEDLIALMEGNARRKGLRLSHDIRPGIPELLRGDAGHLRQILINLIGNAIKFTDRGHVELTVSPIDDGSPVGIRFEVADTGIGISANQLEGLFESFHQAHREGTRRVGGTGLGLSICKRLAEAMGGTIGVRSSVDVGSVFTLDLKFEEAVQGPQDMPLARTTEEPVRSLKVLVVEDNSINREIVRAFLEKAGHGVVEVVSGEAALEALGRTAFDVILMDISLPGIDGSETTRRIRAGTDAACRGVPVIAMSAHVFSDEIDAYLAAGMNGFLGKPFSPDDLKKALSQAINDRPGGQAVFAAKSAPVQSEDIFNPSVLTEDANILGPERIRKMIALFRQTAPETATGIKDAIAAGNMENAASHAHSLKGASGSLGLTALHGLSHRIEKSAKQGTRESLADIAEFDAVLEKSLAALDTFLMGLEDAPQPTP